DMPGAEEITSDTKPIPDVNPVPSKSLQHVPSLNLQPTTVPEPQPAPESAPIAQSEPAVSANETAPETVPEPAVQPEQDKQEEDVMAAFTHEEPESVPSIPAPEPVNVPVEPTQTTPASVDTKEPVPDKTMVLPDVKAVDKEAMRQQEKYSEEQKMQILNAETINLGEAVEAVKKAESEALEVPDAPEEFESLDVDNAPQNSKSAQGLDTILKNMNIGKKDDETEEDPFEFLGSVDDF
nr:hypothetical protein [Eubacterium sp.]